MMNQIRKNEFDWEQVGKVAGAIAAIAGTATALVTLIDTIRKTRNDEPIEEMVEETSDE